jgi:hypothetical protein
MYGIYGYVGDSHRSKVQLLECDSAIAYLGEPQRKRAIVDRLKQPLASGAAVLALQFALVILAAIYSRGRLKEEQLRSRTGFQPNCGMANQRRHHP